VARFKLAPRIEEGMAGTRRNDNPTKTGRVIPTDQQTHRVIEGGRRLLAIIAADTFLRSR
jgi:hypothetical protein